MKSKAIILTGKQQVEIQEREVGEPGPGEVLIQTLVSLISTGTESWCYRGVFEPGTSWAGWVKYPFSLGYSNVGKITAVGAGVEGWEIGDRVCTGLPHTQYGLAPADGITAQVPESVSDEEATWGTLSYVTQTGVRGRHRPGAAGPADRAVSARERPGADSRDRHGRVATSHGRGARRDCDLPRQRRGRERFRPGAHRRAPRGRRV